MTIEPEWMISVDDHLIEPPTLWTDRLPAKYKEIGPHLERDDAGEAWVCEGKRVATVGIAAVVGKPKDDWNPSAVTYDDIRPAAYDPALRIKDMDMSGVIAEALFPSYPRFAGQLFGELEDKELALLCVQAWNDYVLEEWAGDHPGRFIPLAMIPVWDADLAAREAARALEKGARGILFSENIAAVGWPSIHSGHWDPLFSVANDSGFPICMHTGSSSKLPSTSDDCPALVTISAVAINQQLCLLDWLFSGNFFKFENLKIMMSEGEIGWMPFTLMWADHTADTQRWAWKQDFNFNFFEGKVSEREKSDKVIVDPERPPSSLFKDHVYGCFIDDPVGVRNLDIIGEDNVMMETDYPHSDGTWPNSLEFAKKQIAGLSPETQHKLLLGNAMRAFDFTPAFPKS